MPLRLQEATIAARLYALRYPQRRRYGSRMFSRLANRFRTTGSVIRPLYVINVLAYVEFNPQLSVLLAMEKTIFKRRQVDAKKTEEMWKNVKDFQVRDTDVFLMGFAKSGTTWAQELIWLIVNDLDYEGAKAFVDERVPVLELSAAPFGDSNRVEQLECHWNSIEFAKKMKDPRCIKTHLKWSLLPKEILEETKSPKIIYIARNPKDVCLSTYSYMKNVLTTIDCTIDEYSKCFLKGNENRLDHYWEHVLYFWERRSRPNVLFIKYEDMKEDLVKVIKNVSVFLEKTLTDEQILGLVKWLDFETMKDNKAVNHDSLYNKSGFMRAGIVGGHKKEMPAEILREFDSWIEENLKNTDYVL
ncbi:hypothetical protein FQR65_LT18963 [Abscondita terminalis]|nr:hypothetical protein FQR65_LT18963 [Abscondita terminalis]